MMEKRLYKIFVVVCIVIIFNLSINISLKEVYAKDIDKHILANIENKYNKDNVSWDLEKLYLNEKEWQKDVDKFEKDIKELENYIGKVTKSPTHIKFALEIKEKLESRIDKIYAYIKLNQDINKKTYKYLDLKDKVNNVGSKYVKICYDLDYEILKLSEEDYKNIIKDKVVKEKYGNYLEQVRNSKDHYLDTKSERILTNASKVTSLPGKVYNLFRNMDKKNNLNPDEYSKKIVSNDRQERKIAYESEFKSYNDNINTLSGLLIGQVNRNIFYANERAYKSSLDMYLSSEGIDTKVYDNLIKTVDKNLSSLHKYISLRKEVLNLDKVSSYDMFVPIVKLDNEEIPYNKAQDIIYYTTSHLGEEYKQVVYKAFKENWIDVYSNENKVSGGYCFPLYEQHPYILINYNNTLDSVSTLAHELGHGVYEYLTSKNQNYFNANPSVFTHEVASTTNEALLYETLIKNTRNKDQKAYYIVQYLDMIKGTLYMQTMYAEFEKNIHEKAESGESLNALVLNDIWGKLLCKYYGKDYELDEVSKCGWARIPHFYDSFYVYKYATGCSAGVTFAQNIINGQQDGYINLLKAGSSKPPTVLLNEAGVDLTKTKPIEDTLKKFDSLLKELEKTLAI